MISPFLLGALGLAFVLLVVTVMLRLRVGPGPGALLAGALFFDGAAYLGGIAGLPVSPLVLLAGATLVAGLGFLLKSPRAVGAALTHRSIAGWVLFLAYALTSLAWSPNADYGLEKWAVFVARGVVVGVVCCAGIVASRRFSVRPLIWAGCAFALLVLSAGAEYALYPGRLTLGELNPIWIGRAGWCLAIVAIWWSGGSRPLRAAAFVLGASVGLATGSRGPMVAFLAASFVVWVVADRGRRRSRRVVQAALLVLTAGVVVLSATLGGGAAPAPGSDSRLTTLLSPAALGEDQNVLSRLAAQRGAVDVFIANPVFGVGLGGLADPGSRAYPHNLVLEIAAELGLIGVIGWALLLLAALRAARRDRLMLALLVQAIAVTLFSGDLGANNEHVLIALVATGMALAGVTVDAEQRVAPARRSLEHAVPWGGQAGATNAG